MAGNPFRRSMAIAPSADAQHLSTTADAPTTPQKRTKTKRVKIESPPQATQNHGGRRLSASDSATRAPSPPPHRSDDRDDDDAAESDSTATADSDLDQASLNAPRDSGSLPPPTNGMAIGMKAPYNPFARTLASREATFGLQQNNGQSEEQRQRPAMDVDAFKNILLTGSATPKVSTSSGVEGRSSPAVRRPHDSSSSTDTSSIFDSAYALHPESPRVDHYDFNSASDSDEDDDNDTQNENERTNLMGQGRLDDLAPPAPPKPKSARGPQTVSFADFDQSIPPNFQAPGGRGTPPLHTHHRGILRPTVQRSASDLNKPLPPPPSGLQSAARPSPPSVPDKNVPQSQPYLAKVAVTTDDESLTPRKAPPPPPASRRQAATTTRPRSASNLSAQESISDIPDPSRTSDLPPTTKVDELSSSKQPHPPPPPPARKVRSMAPPSAAVAEPRVSVEPKPLVPPPPPRRNPSISGSIRTASPPNSLRKDMSSLPAPGGNAPPPPPPRRAAGGGISSQRSSLDGRPSSARKVSGGTENQRRASGQSVDSAGLEQAAPSPPPEAAPRDVLADMSAFQAEIDALRLQAGVGK